MLGLSPAATTPPFSSNKNPVQDHDFRMRITRVDEELIRRDMESLKFLCMDVVPASAQEKIDRGIDLFTELEDKGKLGPGKLKYLAECLYAIQRIDLLQLLGIEVSRLEQALTIQGEDLSPYRKFLLELSEDLTKAELKNLIYLSRPRLKLTKIIEGRLTNPIQFFLTLERAHLISAKDIGFLYELLSHIARPDLLEKCRQYPGMPHVPVIENSETNAQLQVQQFVNQRMDENELSSFQFIGQSPFSQEVIPKGMPHLPVIENSQTNAWLQPQPCVNQRMEENELPSFPLVGQSLFSPDSIGPKGEGLNNNAVSLLEAQTHFVESNPTEIPTEALKQLQIGESLSSLPVPRLPEYKMSARPRGICLIINNYTFYKDPVKASVKLNNRDGSHVDAGKLEEVFGNLNFDVQCHDNLTDTEMASLCREYARLDHGGYDCFVCCILTHGARDHLFGCNGVTIPIYYLTSNFNSQACPSLADKPKVFFLQACQGKEKQKGFPKMETDSNDGPSHETIPHEADFLLGFSTVPGFVSYRSKTQGSWYITALCESLKNYAHQYDLLSILTTVNYQVSAAEAKIDGGIFKQVPAPQHTLRKKICFH